VDKEILEDIADDVISNLLYLRTEMKHQIAQ
jgi:hypothetical protein